MNVTIEEYSQYFTVTSINFSDLVFKLHDFNKGLTTFTMALKKVGMGRPPKVVTEVDKILYIIERENSTNEKSRNLIRYPISLMPDLIKTLKDLGINYDIHKHRHHDSKTISIERDTLRIPRPYQDETIEKIKKCTTNNTMVSLQTGLGKMEPLDALIKIPNGWKKMGDISLGDTVIGRDGQPTKVIGVYPQGVKRLFKVEFADGRSVNAGLEHLWTVISNGEDKNRKHRLKRTVMNTETIMKYLEGKKKDKSTTSRYYIDLVIPEDFGDIDLPVDPYILGVLLGDGHMKSLRITNISDHILNMISERLPSNMMISRIDRKNLSIKYKDLKDRSYNLKYELTKLGLINTRAWEKFIPPEYFIGSVEQRYELLRGLMDTDGDAAKGGSLSYSTSSEQLAKDIQLLIRGLGNICSISTRVPHFTYKGEKKRGRLSYRLNMRMKEPTRCITLPKRLERVKKVNQYSKYLKLRIDKITEVEAAEAQCIAVDNEDKLYVTNDYIVTHNTLIASYALSDLKKRFMVLILPRFIDKWIGDIVELTDIEKEEIFVITGSKAIIDVILHPDKYDEYKCFILSITSINIFMKAYLHNELDPSLNISPSDITKNLQIDTVLNDEAHMEFHNVYKFMLFSNHRLTLGLSATLVNRDKHIEKMYELGFPKIQRIENITPVDKYIKVFSVRFKFNSPKRIRHSNNFGYNQSNFEKSLVQNSNTLRNYVAMLVAISDSIYYKRREGNDKLVIFVGTVKVCKIIANYFSNKYQDLTVGTYTEEDDLVVINGYDIIITTIGSLGTAIDVKDLISVIQTVNVNSMQTNLQTLGRLRKREDKDVIFAYTWTADIPAHRKYNSNRIDVFRQIAKSVTMKDYRHYI